MVKKKPQKQPGVNIRQLAQKVLKQLPKGTFKTAGGLIGGKLAGPLGSLYGAKAGSVLSRILGAGDYVSNEKDLVVNSLFGKVGSMAGKVPEMHRAGHVTRIQHTEYIKDILSTSSFNIDSYSINPGLENSFPWLSQIAANFESYRFRGLAYMFRTTSGNSVASTNTTLGSVVMATAYNATSNDFPNKFSMENYEGAMSCVPSSSMLHGVECEYGLSALGGHLYVRSGEKSGQDLKTYDMGKFQIATSKIPASGVSVGELWVTYDIELYEPKLYDTLGLDVGFYSAYGVPVSFFPSTVIENTGSNMDVVLSNSTIYFPENLNEGIYAVVVLWTGDSTSTVMPTYSYTNCGIASMFSTAGYGWNNGGATSTQLFALNYVKLSNYNATIALSSGTLPANGTRVDVLIHEVPGNAV